MYWEVDVILDKRIGLFAPSAPVAGLCQARYARAKQELINLGFVPIDTPQTTQVTGFTAGSGKERVEAFYELLEVHGVRMIMATIGGYNANDMLPWLDFARVPEDLVFLGYSDNTVLLHALYAKSGVTALHAPMVLPQFGEYGGVHPFTKESLFEVLGAIQDGSAYQLPMSDEWTDEHLEWDLEDTRARTYRENPGWSVFRDGDCAGVLVPGNVNTLVTLTGTEYINSFSDLILFLEDVDSVSPGEFRRNLMHLSMYFGRRVQGVVVGRFASRSEIRGEVLKNVLQDVFPRVPIMANVDFGHTDPILTLPVGVAVWMCTKEKKIILRV